jgi:hypothetical protein
MHEARPVAANELRGWLQRNVSNAVFAQSAAAILVVRVWADVPDYTYA